MNLDLCNLRIAITGCADSIEKQNLYEFIEEVVIIGLTAAATFAILDAEKENSALRTI